METKTAETNLTVGQELKLQAYDKLRNVIFAGKSNFFYRLVDKDKGIETCEDKKTRVITTYSIPIENIGINGGIVTDKKDSDRITISYYYDNFRLLGEGFSELEKLLKRAA